MNERARCEKWLADDVLALIRYTAKASADGDALLLDLTALHRVGKECARVTADAIEKVWSKVDGIHCPGCECPDYGSFPPSIPWDAVSEEGWPPLKECAVCGKPKSPEGRDVAAAEANAYCHWTEHRAAEEEE